MGSLGAVALFNSNLDAIALLSKLLESAGFTVVSALIPDVRAGCCDIGAMMDRHDPSVVVYDIGPPYAENWNMFQQLRARTSMRDRRFVITAVNASRVEALADGDGRIYEVVDKQSDLGDFVKAVKEAARAHIIRAERQAQSNVTTMAERRHQTDRRHGWTSNEVYTKLREKREAVEIERRRGGRRAVDNDPNHSHAA